MSYTPPKKTHKKCPMCGVIKPRCDFSNRSNKTMAAYCKPCYTKRNADWRKNNPEKARKMKRKYMLKTNYGITPEQYDEIFVNQGGCCGICGRIESERLREGKKLGFAVDHCHETGIVRGILCADCNRGIGQLGDTVEAIQRALDYLKNTPGISTTKLKERLASYRSSHHPR